MMVMIIIMERRRKGNVKNVADNENHNDDRESNIDAAIAIMNEALTIAPNFNLAKISIDALNAQKTTNQD